MGFESSELDGPPQEGLETRTLQLAPAVYGQQAAAEDVTIPKREKHSGKAEINQQSRQNENGL